MQKLPFKTHLTEAIAVVRSAPAILAVLMLLSITTCAALLLPPGRASGTAFSINIFGAVFIVPVMFGYYTEKLEGTIGSLSELFRKYVPGYLVLLLCIYVPLSFFITLISFASGTTETELSNNIQLSLLTFSLLFLYVIPAFFITRTVLASIGYGISFFFRNLFISAPVILMALLSEFLQLSPALFLGKILSTETDIFILLEFIICFAANLLDLLLFIILLLILREQDDLPPVKKRK